MPDATPFLPGMEGEERAFEDLSQFFTPPRLARDMWRWAVPMSSAPLSVLEPSAGNGALIRAMLADDTRMKPRRIVAYEIDPEHLRVLRSLAEQYPAIEVRPRSFLEDGPVERFELALMNPPFEHGQDVAFIMAAVRRCARVVTVALADIEHGKARWESFVRHVEQRRKVNFRLRPRFGGDHSPKKNFKLLELRHRHVPLEPGEPTTVNQEWW